MPLWVKSQDGESLDEWAHFHLRIHKGGEAKLNEIWGESAHLDVMLGLYPTEERAKEVFEEINSAVIASMMAPWVLTDPNYSRTSKDKIIEKLIYEMPKE